ncbi:MAG: RloB family protein [Clostridiales bacterium]|nr:RloB family protein [Clostridiales bacterium]
MGRIKEYKRKAGIEVARPVYAIICEGRNQTESKYLDHFKTRKGISVKVVKCEDTDPVAMVDKANAVIESEGLLVGEDKVFCLVDLDNDEQRKNKIDELKKHNRHINFIISNPSFEVWFLFHFLDNPPRLSNGQAAKRELRKYIANYTESYDVYSREAAIRNNLDVAISRSRSKKNVQNQNEHWIDDGSYPNPYTEVDTLMEELSKNYKCHQ